MRSVLSSLVALCCACSPVAFPDAGASVDAGAANGDAGRPDAGPLDAGGADAGAADAGPPDASTPDAGFDAGSSDAGHGPLLAIFTKTAAFRHDAIPAAIQALGARAAQDGFRFLTTEDAGLFTDAGLADVDVVAFVLTSGDVLDDGQQAAFERWLARGKGYVGVHSATDTEYGWGFYGGLVGAYFQAHPAIQPATLRVERPSHLATAHLPARWTRTDEWYAFQSNPRDEVVVLLSLDEASYAPGTTATGDHPVAWYRGWGGGRAFVTALGHTSDSWSEPAFLDHVWGGVRWASGQEWPNVALAEFDGVAPNGTWSRLQAPTAFPFSVDAGLLTITDVSGQNQHLVREGLTLDAQRPYAVEALFRIAPGTDGLNSFCLDLNLDPARARQGLVDTWAMNVDLGPTPDTGVMKHMGFVGGGFQQLGETVLSWGRKGTEYLLRAEVNVGADGGFAPRQVSASVYERGVERQRFTVDYTPFPYQPPDGGVWMGVNTHGTDWSLRSLRVWRR